MHLRIVGGTDYEVKTTTYKTPNWMMDALKALLGEGHLFRPVINSHRVLGRWKDGDIPFPKKHEKPPNYRGLESDVILVDEATVLPPGCKHWADGIMPDGSLVEYKTARTKVDWLVEITMNLSSATNMRDVRKKHMRPNLRCIPGGLARETRAFYRLHKSIHPKELRELMFKIKLTRVDIRRFDLEGLRATSDSLRLYVLKDLQHELVDWRRALGRGPLSPLNPPRGAA